MVYSVKGLALLVLTLGVGYAVSVLASKEKGLAKTVGYLIAIAIIAAFVVGAILPALKTGMGGISVCPMR